jgi:hypothetical protein
MTKTIAAQFEEYDRRIFWTLFMSIAFGLALYVYFLSTSVYAVVVRKQAEGESERLAAKVSLLESQYVALGKRIDLELAHAEGFVDIAVPRYVRTGESHNTFTLRDGPADVP